MFGLGLGIALQGFVNHNSYMLLVSTQGWEFTHYNAHSLTLVQNQNNHIYLNSKRNSKIPTFSQILRISHMASPEPAHPQPVPIIPTHQPSLPSAPPHHSSSSLITHHPTCPDLPKLSNLKKIICQFYDLSLSLSLLLSCSSQCYAMQCYALLSSLHLRIFASSFLLFTSDFFLLTFYLLFTRESALTDAGAGAGIACVCVYLRLCVCISAYMHFTTRTRLWLPFLLFSLFSFSLYPTTPFFPYCQRKNIHNPPLYPATYHTLQPTIPHHRYYAPIPQVPSPEFRVEDQGKDRLPTTDDRGID